MGMESVAIVTMQAKNKRKKGGKGARFSLFFRTFVAMKCTLALIMLVFSLPLFGQNHHSDALDDVLQHAPMAAVFVLKACDVGSNATPWPELALTAVATYTLGAVPAYSLKQIVGERRPDKSDRRSFPSGHAMFAFAGATMLWHEFGDVSPWVPIGGFGVATLTAVDRLARDRHYLHDICAGAALGVAATELTYFLKRRIVKSKNVDLSFTGQSIDLAFRW